MKRRAGALLLMVLMLHSSWLFAQAQVALALGALPWVMRVGAPLTGLAARWIIQKAGTNALSLVASAELNTWVTGAMLYGLTFTNTKNPTNSPSKPAVDNMEIWTDHDSMSAFSNPDSNIYNNASPTSSDKQPIPKPSYDPRAYYPADPGTYVGVMQALYNTGQLGNGSMGYAKFSGGASGNINEYFWIDVDAAISAGQTKALGCSNASGNWPGAPSFPGASPNPTFCGPIAGIGATSGHHYAIWVYGHAPVCNAGYQLQGQTCVLSGSTSNVTKPVNAPCEAILVNGSWQIDPKNPNCGGATAPIKVDSSDPSKVWVQGGSRPDNSAAPAVNCNAGENSDGTATVRCDNQDGTTTTVNAGQTQPGTGGRPITSVETGQGSTTAPGGPVPTTGPGGGGGGGGGGTGGPGGASGVGGASCGTGGVSCAVTVDDSGFASAPAGVATAASDAASAVGARMGQLASAAVAGSEAQAVDGTKFGLFNAPSPVGCTPVSIALPLGNSSATMDVDVCSSPWVDIAKTIEGYLLWIATGVFIWRRFIESAAIGGS